MYKFLIFTLSLSALSSTDAFAFFANTHTNFKQTTTATATSLPMCPGGWGIGTPNDMQNEEFSKGSSARRRRRNPNSKSNNSSLDEVAYGAESAERAANKYALDDATQFSQRIQREKDTLRQQKKNDLLEIAKIAGLGDRLKPKVNNNRETYGKFEDDVFGDDDGDDDVLDLKVY